MSKPNLPHLKSSKDLETTYEAVRAGFVALALEKNRQATPYIQEARALKVAASTAKTPSDLLEITDIQSALLTASGISNKANNHLLPKDKKEAIKGLNNNAKQPMPALMEFKIVMETLPFFAEMRRLGMRRI